MDNEKIVRDLVNTFNDRDHLHLAYKNRMKYILLNFFCAIHVEYESYSNEIDPDDLMKFIDTYVEEHFKPEK